MHAIARTPYTNAKLEEGCIGSLFIFRADEGGLKRLFDYRDFNYISTLLFRISDIAILVAFDDAGMSAPYLASRVNAIVDNPLSPLQLREMLAHLAYVRSTLNARPGFWTEYQPDSDSVRIVANVPNDKTLQTYDDRKYGDMLYLCVEPLITSENFDNPAEVAAEIKSGRVGFTVDENFKFFSNGKLMPKVIK